jgi:ferric-dicitrate binding protein FerR (iron transport regulator)
MTQQHPITPPPELFAEWLAEAKRLHPGESTGFIAGEVARLAYQAGADQELEACCEWLANARNHSLTWQEATNYSANLRATRRPKAPIDSLNADLGLEGKDVDLPQIRRAIEQLPDSLYFYV